VTVVRYRDGSLVVPARVTTSDGSLADAVKRIDRRHPLYDAWSSYCERYPEDVVVRRRMFGENGEDLSEALGAAAGGLVLFLLFFAVDAAKGLPDGVAPGSVVALGVLWVGCWFIGGLVYSRRERDRSEARLRLHGGAEVEPPPASPGWSSRQR